MSGGLPFISRRLRFDPYRPAGNAAIYSLWGAPSDMTYIVDGSGRLQLVADRSGNSGVNGLVLNGVAGNYASVPDSAALSITGDIDLRADVSLQSVISAVDQRIICKRTTTTNFDFYLRTDGKLDFYDGIDQFVSTEALPSARISVRVVFRPNNDAGARTATFYTSPDFVSWTQLGTSVTLGTAGALTDTADIVTFGAFSNGSSGLLSGSIYRAQIRSGIDGTIVLDADFTRVAKLASSFVCSTGQVVTINTSGDTGARICGARDAVQLTQAEQQIVSVVNGRNLATNDGLDDYIKSAPYPHPQAATRYTVFRQNAWTSGKVLWDGNTAGSSKLSQAGLTPAVQLNAGVAGPASSAFTIGALAVCVEVIAGAASTIAKNTGADSVAADAGATGLGGTTIGADGAGNNSASMAWCERIERTGVDSKATRVKVAKALLAKWGASA